jgi:hypothetical protein
MSSHTRASLAAGTPSLLCGQDGNKVKDKDDINDRTTAYSRTDRSGQYGSEPFARPVVLKNVDLRFICDTNTAKAGELAVSMGAVSGRPRPRPGDETLYWLPHLDPLRVHPAVQRSRHRDLCGKTADRHAETSEIITCEDGDCGSVGSSSASTPCRPGRWCYGTERVIGMGFSRKKVSSRITDVDVVMDLMIHDIDLALYLNGPAREVSAYGVTEEGMIAFARATITHDNGSFSNITASRITEKRIRKISVTAADKYIDCNLLRRC